MNRLMHSAPGAYLIIFLLVVGLAACNNDDDSGSVPVRPEENIIEVINQTEGLDSMIVLVNLYNGLTGSSTVTSRLSGSEHTVFAPNNTAFVNLLSAIGLQSLSQLNGDIISGVLLYHIVPNVAYSSFATQADSSLTTLGASQLQISTEGDSVRINAGTQPDRTVVVTPDLGASNGVIHIINEVLLPTSLTASSTTTQSVASTFGTVAGLTSTLGVFGGISTINSVFNFAGLKSRLASSSPHTALTPVDAAFDNFNFTSEQNVLDVANYHVIDGNVDFANAGRTITSLGGDPIYVTLDDGDIFLNGVFAGDFGFTASNGRIVHLAGVLKPAVPLTEMISYVENLSGNTFTIFRTALEETEINLGQGKTIFMPTDQAFAAAGLEISIDSAARLDPALLTTVLQTHVFEGINFSSDVVLAESVSTTALNGTPLTISLVSGTDGASLTVEDANATTETAQVIDFDYLTDNGVVHIINQVLLPTP